jgi:hypothetical protein
MTELMRFWQEVYVAAIRAGKKSCDAENDADAAVKAFSKRAMERK